MRATINVSRKLEASYAVGTTDSVFNGRALVQDVEHDGLFGMEAMIDVMISNEGKRCSRRRAYKSDIQHPGGRAGIQGCSPEARHVVGGFDLTYTTKCCRRCCAYVQHTCTT